MSLDGDRREIGAPRTALVVAQAARAGGAHAAAQHVGADDEVAVGVDWPAGPDHHVPPAILAGDRMGLGDILIAGQRMADQHGVGARRIQRAVGAIRHRHPRQPRAAVQRHPSSKMTWGCVRWRRVRSTYPSRACIGRVPGCRNSGGAACLHAGPLPLSVPAPFRPARCPAPPRSTCRPPPPPRRRIRPSRMTGRAAFPPCAPNWIGSMTRCTAC